MEHCHEAIRYRTTISSQLRNPNKPSNMVPPKFSSIGNRFRRMQRKTRTGRSEEPMECDRAVGRLFTAPAPDLGIYLPIPGTSTPGDQEPNDHDAAPGPLRSVLKKKKRPLEGSLDNTTNPGETSRPDFGSQAHSAAIMTLRGVKEAADTFPPLKSAAAALCFILDNCENTLACHEKILSLIPRVKEPGQSLSAPAPQGEIEEELRRKSLECKLNNILKDLMSLAQRGKITRFLNNTEDAGKLSSMIEDIHYAVMEYQTLLQQDLFQKSCQLIEAAQLTLLDRMGHATNTGYLCSGREGCMGGTRRDVLQQLENWLLDTQDKHVFWLNGLAGTGKSTIAQTFAEITFADGMLGASFFCSQYFENRSNLKTIFPTLVFQLACKYPPFRAKLLPVLVASPGVGQESLSSQMEKLIIRPFQETQITTLVIIDALDECRDEEPASALLCLLAHHLHMIPLVKFFITGRPEPHIRAGFRLESLQPHTDILRLHEVSKSSVDEDIKLYFQRKLTSIAKNRSDFDLLEEWPSSADLDKLCVKAAGLFIYASTVIKFVASKDHQPTERLTVIVSLPKVTIQEGRSGLDHLYTEVLRVAFLNQQADDERFYSCFRSVVGTVVLVFNPLSITTLSNILQIPVPNISTALHSLHSLLILPTNRSDQTPIHVIHKSFPDFLTDPERCTDKSLFIHYPTCHKDILLSCLKVMKRELKKNICQLDDHIYLKEVEDLPEQRARYIGDGLKYASQFWTHHLLDSVTSGPDVEEVYQAIDDFFTSYLLFWIEVLCLMKKLDIGVYALKNIDQWYMQTGVSCKWTKDSQHFILENFDMIKDSPYKIYQQAVMISPFTPFYFLYSTPHHH